MVRHWRRSRQLLPGLIRELAEELGIEARVAGEIGRYEYAYPGRAPILLIFYRVSEFRGEPKNLDFEKILWMPLERMGEFDFLEGDTEFLKRYPNINKGSSKA